MLVLKTCGNSSMLNAILFIKSIINIVFIVAPIILALFFTIDLAKNVLSKDNQETQKNIKLGIKRIIYSVILMFVPLLVKSFMSMVSDYSKVANCYTIATEEKVTELKAKEDAEYKKKQEEKAREREKQASDIAVEQQEQEKIAREAEKVAQKQSQSGNNTPMYSQADVPEKYIKANGKVAQAAGPSHPQGSSYPYSLYDAKSGDQNGREVVNLNMHNGWTYIARFKDPIKANLMALCMGNATKNDHIGYDGSKATTLFYEAKKYDFDVSKVTKNVDTTCSNLVCVCINYAGTSFPDSASCRNNNLYKQLTKRSSVFTVKSYKAGMSVYRGDILFTDVHTGVAL